MVEVVVEFPFQNLIRFFCLETQIVERVQLSSVSATQPRVIETRNLHRMAQGEKAVWLIKTFWEIKILDQSA